MKKINSISIQVNHINLQPSSFLYTPCQLLSFLMFNSDFSPDKLSKSHHFFTSLIGKFPLKIYPLKITKFPTELRTYHRTIQDYFLQPQMIH